MHSFRYSVTQSSLEQLVKVLPAGWQVQKHWPTDRAWYIGPHAKHIVSVTNGTHSIWLPDNQNLSHDMLTDHTTPITQNPIHTTWNPIAHGNVIREIASYLDNRGGTPRSVILTPWYYGEKHANMPENALGVTSENMGNALLVRSPLLFVKKHTGEHDLDSLEPESFNSAVQKIFGSGPEYCEDENHTQEFGERPIGHHLLGAQRVLDVVRHEDGHTKLIESINGSLPSPSPMFPRESKHTVEDSLLPVYWNEVQRQYREGTLGDSLARSSRRFAGLREYWRQQGTSLRGARSEPEYLSMLASTPLEEVKRQYRQDPGLYLGGSISASRQKNAAPDVIPDLLAACANSLVGAQNIQESIATAHEEHANPCVREKTPFTKQIAQTLGWEHS